MNASSVSPAETATGPTRAGSAAPRRTLVWDLPVRLVHAGLIASFAGAWLTAESERWQWLHMAFGLTMAGLVVFRLAWGLVGSRHARFASFVRGPSSVVRYLRSLVSARPEHHVGHNPAGGWAVLALLGLAVAVTATGIANWQEIGGHAVEELHEGIATALLILVGVHVAAVLVSSRLHRENLIAAMVDGRKAAAPSESSGRPRRMVAALLAAAVLGFWGWWWTQPVGGPDDGRAAVTIGDTRHGLGRDDDDD